MYFPFRAATDLLAEKLGIDPDVCFSIAIHGRHEDNYYVQDVWTRETVIDGLRRHADLQDASKDGGKAERDRALGLIDRVPDDTICAAIGWYCAGHNIASNDGILNNSDEAAHANLLAALDVKRLNEVVLFMLDMDIERFELVAPVALVEAIERMHLRDKRRHQALAKRRQSH